jgi:hypothetical protein
MPEGDLERSACAARQTIINTIRNISPSPSNDDGRGFQGLLPPEEGLSSGTAPQEMDADLRGFADGSGIKLNNAAMQIGDHYKGFVITWVEPPVSAHEWVLNINAKNKDEAGHTKLARTGVIKGATLDEAMAKAKQFIDEL